GSSTTDRYDGDVAFVDHHFGRLFDWLDSTGRLKNTMIVFMADHGESLGERLVHLHSTQLYNEQTHIPMIVFIPGVGPRRVPNYVSSVDLGPTILNAAGLDYPSECAGVSLLPLARGKSFQHPPLYGEQTMAEDSPYVMPSQGINPVSKKYMVITQDGFKLIYDRDFYCFELYDLRQDPGEFHNLYDQMPDRDEVMKQLLGRYIDVVQVSRPEDADELEYSEVFMRTHKGVHPESKY
ncbi:MAG: sulfatase family protein, partial [Blastocatellia bacterium]